MSNNRTFKVAVAASLTTLLAAGVAVPNWDTLRPGVAGYTAAGGGDEHGVVICKTASAYNDWANGGDFPATGCWHVAVGIPIHVLVVHVVSENLGQSVVEIVADDRAWQGWTEGPGGIVPRIPRNATPAQRQEAQFGFAIMREKP